MLKRLQLERAAATRKKNARKNKKQIVGFRKKNGKTIPITASSKRHRRTKIASNSKKHLSVKPKKPKKESAVEVIGDKAKEVGGLIADGVFKAAKVAAAVVKDGIEAIVDVGKETEEKAVETGKEAEKVAEVAVVVA